MTQNSRRLHRRGALLCLIPFALYLLTSDGGLMQTLDLPSTWNASIFTNLWGWSSKGGATPTDQGRLLEALRPGDRVRIYCRTIRMTSGDEASLLVYIIDGPAGRRLYGSVWNPLVLAAILVSTLLPFLLCLILAIENELRRDAAPK